MIPEYILVLMSIYLILGAIFWTAILIKVINKRKVTLGSGLTIVTLFWCFSSLAPVWGIAMLWRHFS